MPTVTVSTATYSLLKRQADAEQRQPDRLADEILQRELSPAHAYIEIVERPGGPRAMLKGTRIAVDEIIGYLRLGETPESLASELLAGITLAQVHDALSYYYDHEEEINQILQSNTTDAAQATLRQQLGETDYLRLTGQTR